MSFKALASLLRSILVFILLFKHHRFYSETDIQACYTALKPS